MEVSDAAASFAVVADGFNRTTQYGFFTGRELFFANRLLVNKGIVIGIAATKVFRRSVTTDITVDTGRVDVVSAGHVFLHTIVTVGH